MLYAVNQQILRLAIYFILYWRHYIQKLNFFNYEKHIISHRSDTDYWMAAWFLCVQRIRIDTYPDRTGSYRLVTGIDPQSVIFKQTLHIPF
jgi:hypothetical protein